MNKFIIYRGSEPVRVMIAANAEEALKHYLPYNKKDKITVYSNSYVTCGIYTATRSCDA